MSIRKIVSREEVNAWMTQELTNHEDCAGSTLNVQYMLQAPDESGCNWSGDCNLSTGPGTDARHIAPIAAAIVARAQAKFNLAK
jgi:hypothetical protein